MLFFHHLTGLSYTVVGTVLGVTAVVVLPVLGPIGTLADRLGPRPIIVAACAVRVAGFVAVSLTPSVATFVLCALLSAAGNRAEQSCAPALLATLAPPEAVRRYLGVWRAAFNTGLGVGALIGAALITDPAGLAALGLVNAASFALAAALVLALPRSVRRPAPATVAAEPARWRWRSVDPRLAAVVGVDALLWVVAVGVETGLSVYLVQLVGAPAWVVGACLATSTVIVAGGQVPVALFLERHRLGEWLAAGAALHLAMPAALIVAGSAGARAWLPWLLLPLVVTAAIGEVLATQAATMALLELAPAAHRARTLAFGQQVVGLGVAATPVLVGSGLDTAPRGLWVLLAVLVVLATAVAMRVRRGVDAGTRPASAATPDRDTTLIRSSDAHGEDHR